MANRSTSRPEFHKTQGPRARSKQLHLTQQYKLPAPAHNTLVAERNHRLITKNSTSIWSPVTLWFWLPLNDPFYLLLAVPNPRA